MYGAPGILTAFLVTSGAASIALMWSWGRGARVTAMLIAVVVAIDVVIASARSAWVGVAAGLLVAGIAALATGQRVRLPRSTRGRAALAAGVAVGAVAMIGLAPALLRRLSYGRWRRPARHVGRGLAPAVRRPPARRGRSGNVGHLAGDLHGGRRGGLLHSPRPQRPAPDARRDGPRRRRGGPRAGRPAPAPRHPRPPRRQTAAERHWAIGVLFIAPYLLVHQLFDFFMDMPAVLFAAACRSPRSTRQPWLACPPRYAPRPFDSWRAAVVPVIAAVTRHRPPRPGRATRDPRGSGGRGLPLRPRSGPVARV